MNDDNKIKELLNAIGVLAETSIFFYRAVLQAGATPGEAMVLVQAFIKASMLAGGEKSNRESENEE